MQKKNIKNQFFNFWVVVLFSVISITTAQAAGVTLTAVPSSNTITVGKTATYTIKINRDGYTDKVILSATGLPSGATAGFSPNTTTAASSTLTVKTLTSTPIGTFNITVKGTANGISIAPIVVQLITKPQGSVTVSVDPETQSIIAGQETYYEIQIKRTNYDGLVTLTAENVPNGVTVKFEPASTNGNTSRMYLYSNGLPFLSNQYSMLVRAKGIADIVEGLTVFYLKVNCGIVWADQFGTPNNNAGYSDFATDVTFDLNSNGKVNNTYVVGHSKPFGGTNHDVWVAKYDVNGARIWLLTINNSSTEEYAKRVAVDSSGNVYVAGYFRTADNFINYDAFIAKVTPNGVLSAVRTVGSNYEDGTGGMIINFDSAGNVYFTIAANIRRSNGDSYDLRVYGFNAAFGNPSQTVLTSSAAGDPKDLAIAPDGSIYVVGDFEDVSDDFGFIAKHNANGNLVWREEYFLRDFNPKKVTVDSDNNVYVATQNRTTNGNYSVGVRKYYSNHTSYNPPAWSFVESSPDEYEVKAIAVDNQHHVYFGGSLRLNGWFTKLSTISGNSLLKREFLVTDKDSFNAFKANDNNELFIAGDTVTFKNVNYGYEDALILRYSTYLCFF